MKFLLILSIPLMLTNCHKEKATAQDTSVFDTSVSCPESIDSLYKFPEPDGLELDFGDHWLNDTLFQYPSFNPNNSSEISYVEQLVGGAARLMKYDLKTNTKTVLRNELILAEQPVWCSNNWSYFMGYGQNMVRVNMNTGELNMLTNINKDRSITSNIETGQFTFLRYMNSTTVFKIMSTSSGDDFDTIPQIVSGDWVGNLMAGGEGYGSIVTLFPNSQVSEVLHSFPTEIGYSLNDIKIHPNKIDIYASCWFKDGIYKINRNTKQLTIVKRGDNNCWYDTFSISQDGKSIVFEKVLMEIQNWNQVFSKREVWIMDIDGCNERKLNL